MAQCRTRLAVSAHRTDLEFWRTKNMWAKLDLVRIYTKPRGVKVPDYTAPVVLKRGHCTVEDFCAALHK